MSGRSTKKPETGLATREILEEWLSRDGMSLWDAALIAHGARPGTDTSGLSKDREDGVYETASLLGRLIKLKPAKTDGDVALYETAKVFRELQEAGYAFPTLVAEVLTKKRLIRSQSTGQRKRHANAERFENERIEVMKAMIRALTDPTMNLACRKNGDATHAVVGEALARTVIEHQERLFDDAKANRKPGSIAKLFNEIVRPQVT